MIVTVFRPRFADYALKMKRGAQVDLPEGPRADRHVHRHLSRCSGARGRNGFWRADRSRCAGRSATAGRVVSYEAREEHHEQAVRNIEGFFGKLPDILESADRAASRMSVRRGSGSIGARSTLRRRGSPWSGGRRARARWRGVLPICRPRSRYRSSCSRFLHKGSCTSKRSRYCAEGGTSPTAAYGPDHRMVGHTGFLTVGRRLA